MRRKKNTDLAPGENQQELEARVEAFMSDKPLPKSETEQTQSPEIDIFAGADMPDVGLAEKPTVEEIVEAGELSVGDAEDEPEDDTTKHAVEEIMAEDGDIVLAAVDAQVVEPPKFAKTEPKKPFTFPLITKLLVALAVAAIVVFIIDARAH